MGSSVKNWGQIVLPVQIERRMGEMSEWKKSSFTYNWTTVYIWLAAFPQSLRIEVEKKEKKKK